jgi:hypothetical protein
MSRDVTRRALLGATAAAPVLAVAPAAKSELFGISPAAGPLPPSITIPPAVSDLGADWVALYRRAVLKGSPSMRQFILRFAFATEEQRLVMAEVVEQEVRHA